MMKNAMGVIGGMGSMASEVFYRMVIARTPAACDQEHINMILLNHADMPDRTAAIKAGDDSEMAQKVQRLLKEDALFLQQAGCRAFVVTCNTAHYFVHRFEKELQIPCISMIRAAAEELSERFPGGRIAVLGTDGTLSTGLYQDALAQRGLHGEGLDAAGQAAVMGLIYDCVKAGKPADPALLKLVEDRALGGGYDAALLACTELSVLKEDGVFSDFFVDAMDVLARRFVEFSQA